jgi:hypothetical protein
VPNAWLNNLLLSGVRNFVLNNFQLVEIVNTPIGVFADATVDTVIFNISKNDIRNQNVKISTVNNNNIEFLQNTKQDIFIKNNNFVIDIFTNDLSRDLVSKIEIGTIDLEKITDMSSGIKEYEVGKGKPKQTIEDKMSNKFNADFKKDHTYLRHISGSEISNYTLNWKNTYLSYGEWLGAPRQKKYFEGERILIREIPGKIKLIAAFTDEEFTVKNSAHICKKINDEYNLKYTLAILNSLLIGYYFKFKFAEFDNVFPKAKIGQCKKLPIKVLKEKEQFPFVNKVDSIINFKSQFDTIIQKFSTYFSSQYHLEKLPGKLEKWYELEFVDFIKELNKAIKAVKGTPLTKKDEFEWMDLFEENKKKALELKAEIDNTDKEIDRMVYELYGLSEEEIQIVENS